jgi:pimeloyl-ACP methyl ester carboxylesterase
MRVERSGVGDSEGPASRETDFFADVAAYRAALESLRGDPGVRSVILFGHSVGGMIAPLLASEGSGIDGVVVFGTSAWRWHECIVRTTRRQRELAGLQGEALESYVSGWAELNGRVCRDGLTPEQVFAQSPRLRMLEGSAARGNALFGRVVAFYQQLDRVDLRALWSTVACPVLVAHGEYDWVCATDEGREIAERIDAVSPGRARFVELSRVGHDFRTHESLARSFADPRAGRWDGSVMAAIDAWLPNVIATP